jgi:nitroreductase
VSDIHPDELTLSAAVDTRRSVRAFLNRPVDMALIKQILALAARAPSGGNLQPWRITILAGKPLERFRCVMARRIAENPTRDEMQYQVYPDNLAEPYRTQRFRVGEAMYATLGIPREDKAARLRWFHRNYQFFGAPVGLFVFVDRHMGVAQWVDLGIYLQTVMLLLRSNGLDSCPQEAWAAYHTEVSGFLGTDADWVLFSGLAVGYADETAPVNNFRSERMALDNFATVVGDD